MATALTAEQTKKKSRLAPKRNEDPSVKTTCRAHKFMLVPTPEVEEHFRRFAGACRWVWNRGLALQKERLDRKEKLLSWADLNKLLTAWRNAPETSWLQEAPCACQQYVNIHLDRAFKDFFKLRKLGIDRGPPRFKVKGKSRDAFSVPHPAGKLDQRNHRVFLPKVGWVVYRGHRPVEGKVKTITVSRDGERWYVSVLTEREGPLVIHKSKVSVGVDLGVAKTLTLSTGEHMSLPASIAEAEAKVAREQRKLSRRTKFSANWLEQKKRVAKAMRRVTNLRENFQQHVSKSLANEYCLIAAEDLNVKAMTKSAAGTVEEPGKNVAAKSALNRSILRQGWGDLTRMLTYKAEDRGGSVVLVDPRNTSRGCSECGFVHPENRPSQATFQCLRCGHEENADVNAAKNVLARALVPAAL